MTKLFAALCATLFLAACAPTEPIFNGIAERDANEIVSVLFDASIKADKVLDPKTKNYAIVVRKDEAQRSVAVLSALGLPHATRPAITELFKSTGFAPTPFEERVRFIYGTTQELERTLSLMPGVLKARVHVVIPEQAKRGEKVTAKASVYVNFDERYPLLLETPKIRRLVAESIDGLEAERVEVFMTSTKVDMKKVSSVPLSSFAGIRVHADDFQMFLIAIVGLLTCVVGLLIGLFFSSFKGRK